MDSDDDRRHRDKFRSERVDRKRTINDVDQKEWNHSSGPRRGNQAPRFHDNISPRGMNSRGPFRPPFDGGWSGPPGPRGPNLGGGLLRGVPPPPGPRMQFNPMPGPNMRPPGPLSGQALEYDIVGVRSWILDQPENISFEAVCENYPKFRANNVRSTLSSIFEFYKNAVWFKEMYHPSFCDDTYARRRAKVSSSRLETFLILDDGRLDDVTLAGKASIKPVATLLKQANALLDPQSRVVKKEQSSNKPEPDDVSEDEDEATEKEKEPATTDKKEEEKADGEIELDFEGEEEEGAVPRVAAGEAVSYLVFQLRNFPPQVKKSDLEKALKDVPGFCRLSVAYPWDGPHPMERKATASFQNIGKTDQIRNTLRDIRIDGQQLAFGPARNKEFIHIAREHHVRSHPSDSELIKKLVRMYDEKYDMWTNSENPMLGEDISDDKRILYLRIVYSYDFYSGVEDQYEDDMPMRVGYITLRKDNDPLKNYNGGGFRASARARLDAEVFPSKELLNDMKRSPDVLVEQFVKTHTKPVKHGESQVFECTLSGKLFKSEEFVKKHIMNKHQEKVESVKQEATFFNNYLNDSLRVRRCFDGGSMGPQMGGNGPLLGPGRMRPPLGGQRPAARPMGSRPVIDRGLVAYNNQLPRGPSHF
eukprot:m.78793 g.78793  ORF g.78793 m.78793 type:complete len:646 (+) comp12690_c0_seq3:269-2206(+)